jgi:hypothetical protein
MFKSSVVLSLVKSVESVLKTDRLAAVSCVRISLRKGLGRSIRRISLPVRNECLEIHFLSQLRIRIHILECQI